MLSSIVFKDKQLGISYKYPLSQEAGFQLFRMCSKQPYLYKITQRYLRVFSYQIYFRLIHYVSKFNNY